MEITPLESWINGKILEQQDTSSKLTRSQIEAYQLQKLKETIDLAKSKSYFYRKHLADVENINSLEELKYIPFTTSEDIRFNPMHFLCVSQSEINRVVTLQSSGTTGLPKRLFFTRDDHELTVDFFHHGMSTLVKPGDRILILLPGEQPDSVGDLLVRGLASLGATGIPHGPVRDVAQTAEVLVKEKVDSVVGIPIHVLALARHLKEQGRSEALQIKSVLLSTDYVPKAIVKELEYNWGCKVFNHYGMTEMGLGGGVDCQALGGYHLREADLYFEIINPSTGEPVADGEAGEVVFTTLTRRGMPLIRYRTGDLARFIPEPCSCGTILKRMKHVKYRLASKVFLKSGDFITMADLDEVILTFSEVRNYQASLVNQQHHQSLNIVLEVTNQPHEAIETLKESIYKALLEIPALQPSWQEKQLVINLEVTRKVLHLTNGTGKRVIHVC